MKKTEHRNIMKQSYATLFKGFFLKWKYEGAEIHFEIVNVSIVQQWSAKYLFLLFLN
jgi:hypothetical protein